MSMHGAQDNRCEVGCERKPKCVCFLCTVSSEKQALLADYAFVRQLFREGASSRYVLTSDPETADLICFVGALYDDLRDIVRSPVYKSHSRKAVTIQTRDHVYARVPGLYASSSVRASRWLGIRSCCYPRVSIGEYCWNADETIRYLYSFVGSFRTAGIRDRLGDIHDSQSLIIDTDETTSGPWISRYDAENQENYYRILAQSKFVLCPRGRGLSSMRLFETLAAGRVPVIISDGFALPSGPDWASCSLVVKEKDISELPVILRRHETEWETMAKNALEVWMTWYSKAHAIDVYLDDCQASRHAWNPVKGWLAFKVMQFRPHYVCSILLPDIVQVLVKVKHSLGIKISFRRLFLNET